MLTSLHSDGGKGLLASLFIFRAQTYGITTQACGKLKRTSCFLRIQAFLHLLQGQAVSATSQRVRGLGSLLTWQRQDQHELLEVTAHGWWVKGEERRKRSPFQGACGGRAQGWGEGCSGRWGKQEFKAAALCHLVSPDAHHL